MHLTKARTMTTTSFDEFWAGFSPGQLQELGRGSHRAISRGSWSTWRQRRPGTQRRPWTNKFAFTVLKLKDEEDLPPHEEAFNVVSPCSSLSKPVRLGVGQPVMWVGLIKDKFVFSIGELDQPVRCRVLQFEFNQGDLGGSLFQLWRQYGLIAPVCPPSPRWGRGQVWRWAEQPSLV